MILKFDDGEVSSKNGNKANSLIVMRKAGFPVPDGFVLDSSSFVAFIKGNNLEPLLKRDLAKGAGGLSKETLRKIDEASFDEETIKELDNLLDSKKKYAVRSSCTKEDLGDLSFAGQYESFLYTKKDDVIAKIKECYKSTYNKNIVAYCSKNNISLRSLRMAVVVQEMVDPDYSGICFTVDPMRGNDKTMLIEIAAGIGENLVSGHKAPEQYFYNWYNDKTIIEKKNKFLNEKQVRKFGQVFSDIQIYMHLAPLV